MDDATNHDDDEVIEPDQVSAGGSRSTVGDDDSFGLDDLAEAAVGALLGLLGRASKLAGGVLMFSGTACLVGYLLGIVALRGGLRIFWVIVGGLLVAWAVGSVLVALWRLRVVRAGSGALVEEVRSLIGGDQSSERTVIDTVESTRDAEHDGIVTSARQFASLREAVRGQTANFAQLSLALSSITTFPGLMALATVIGVGFTGVSLIFVLILIF